MALGPASSHSVEGVEILNLFGGLPGYPAKPNSEYLDNYLGSQTARDKLRGREGNNPDRQLRSLKLAKWETKWEG